MDGLAAFARNTAGMLLRLPVYYPSAQAVDQDGLIVVRAGQSAATFNGVMIHNQAAATITKLESLHAEYRAERLPYAIEVFTPEELPECDPVLIEAGYQRTSVDPVMAAEGPLNDPLVPATPARNRNVTVNLVCTDADREAYKRVLMTVFNVPAGVSQDFFDSMMAIKESRQMLALLGDVAVGSGMLLYIDDTASIYNIATLPESQHQGVGTAMMFALHNKALADGFPGTALVVQSTEGQSLYRRIGYQQCGWRSTYERYL